VYVSFQAAEILLKTPYYSGFFVIADTPDNVASVQAAIQSQYGGDVNVFNAGAMVSSVTAITGQMTVFLGSIGAVSLFVAAVGIANTMYVSVMERTREIGVLKALGYKGRQIMSMFLSEAVVTGIMGGLLGTLLGYALAFALGGQIPLSNLGRGFRGGPGGGGGSSAAPAAPPIFTPELILFSLIFPILISVAAGLYPAWRASKMNPINALKYE
jgi:putative ABC transport system permease protein